MITFGNANPNTKMYITYDDPSLASQAGAQLQTNIYVNCTLSLRIYEYLNKMLRMFRKISDFVYNSLSVAI